MDKRYIILGAGIVLLLIFGILLIINTSKPKTTELNFVTQTEDEKNFAQILPAFEQANKVKVNLIKIDSNYEVESLNRLSTGKIDIWGIPASWLPKQHDKLTAAPSALAGSYNTLYPSAIVSQNKIQGNIYGAPLSLDSLVLFANPAVKPAPSELSQADQDLLAKTPENWQDLALQAQLVTTKSAGTITRSGAALGTANIPSSSDILTVLMLQYGAQMTNAENSQATFHTAVNVFGGESYPGAAALDFYTSFAKADNKNYSFSDTMGEALRTFATGKAAYYVDYSAKEADIKRINPDLNFQIYPLPQIEETKNPVNFLSYETMTVPQSSKNQTMAWKLIEFLTAQANADLYYFDSGNHPALSYKISDVQGIVEKQVETAKSWYNPDATAVDQIFRSAISQVLSGKGSQTVLDGAAVDVTSLLGKIKE